MRDTILSWALINAVFALLFYLISAFVFWQLSPGDWPVQGRAILGSVTVVFLGYTTLVAVGNLREE